jgi:hypothetical protein
LQARGSQFLYGFGVAAAYHEYAFINTPLSVERLVGRVPGGWRDWLSFMTPFYLHGTISGCFKIA